VARVVDLDALVPDDIDFQYRGKSYPIPGDIDVETTFSLIKMFEEASNAERSGASVEEREALNLTLRNKLTELFRIRQPELTDLPFGTIAYQHILAEVLQAIGLQIAVEEPKTPPKPRARKQTVPRSRRSTGSPK
jgi:hypothetical protein